MAKPRRRFLDHLGIARQPFDVVASSGDRECRQSTHDTWAIFGCPRGNHPAYPCRLSPRDRCSKGLFRFLLEAPDDPDAGARLNDGSVFVLVELDFINASVTFDRDTELGDVARSGVLTIADATMR